jgi:hypothetical protein
MLCERSVEAVVVREEDEVEDSGNPCSSKGEEEQIADKAS